MNYENSADTSDEDVPGLPELKVDHALIDDWNDDIFKDRLEDAKENELIRPSNSSPNKLTSSNADASNPCAVIANRVCDDTWNNILYDYQKEGIQWLYALHSQGTGGILGDEMGLGKTIQICVHFAIIAAEQAITPPQPSRRSGAKHQYKLGCQQTPECPIFLIIAPVTVLHHWVSEFHQWVPQLRILTMHSTSGCFLEVLRQCGGRKGLSYLLNGYRRDPLNYNGIVVIISYDGVQQYHKDILLPMSNGWNGVVIDEGQKIRNPEAAISTTCKLLPSYHRIILSGTPIQNSLKELWSLFDFIYPNLLGTLESFDREFAHPIRMGNFKSSSQLTKEISIRTAYTLQRIIQPFLLRRKKEHLIAVAQLPKKTEHVLFCKLTSVQRDAYLNVLASSEVRDVLNKKYPAFAAITTLRKICNHPSLGYYTGKNKWEYLHNPDSVDGSRKRRKLGISGSENTKDASRACSPSVDVCIPNPNSCPDSSDLMICNGEVLDWRDSGKLTILSKILPQWFLEGNKVLIFTQTQSMLTLIESMLHYIAKKFAFSPGSRGRNSSLDTGKHFRFSRLDGSTPVKKRQALIYNFNNDDDIFAMILTTKTGGVGISLTAANRVIIMDPDWNPQTDVQARERAWRIGQKREVTIYRLITRGTIEECIYKRQIFKLLLTSRILDNPKQKALFAKSDISELFQLTDNADVTSIAATQPCLKQKSNFIRNKFAGKSSNHRYTYNRHSTANEVEMVTTYTDGIAKVEYVCGNVSNNSVLMELPEDGKMKMSHGSNGVPVLGGGEQFVKDDFVVDLPQVDGERELEIGERRHTSDGQPEQQQEFDDELNLDVHQDPTSILMNNADAHKEIDMGALEKMFKMDLSGELEQGETPDKRCSQPLLNSEKWTGTSYGRTKESSNVIVDQITGGSSKINAGAGAGSGEEPDKMLLRALYDGDDITAVYDHSFAETTNSSAPGNGFGGRSARYHASSNPNQIREYARKVVDKALSKFTSDVLEDEPLTQANFSSQRESSSSNANVDSTEAMPSSSMLSRLKNLGAKVANDNSVIISNANSGISGSYVSAESDSASQRQQTHSRKPVKDTMKTKIIKLFHGLDPRGQCGVPTDSILVHFRYLDDAHAPLFKSILNHVAVCKTGKWFSAMVLPLVGRHPYQFYEPSFVAEKNRVNFFSLFTLLGAILLVIIIHIPTMGGHKWPDCNGALTPNLRRWCVFMYHIFDFIPLTLNLFVAGMGYFSFTPRLQDYYYKALGIVIAVNIAFACMEVNEIIVRLDGSYTEDYTDHGGFPVWELYLLGFACFMFLLQSSLGIYILVWRTWLTPYPSDGYFHPRTEQEIVHLIKWANVQKKKIRVCGSRHSVPDAYWNSTDTMIRVVMDEYRGIDINMDLKQVTVCAGCNLGIDPYCNKSTLENSLLFNLQNCGLALGNLGGIRHQTVSGFISTNSQGGSLSQGGADIIEMKIVNGVGQVMTYRKDKTLVDGVLVTQSSEAALKSFNNAIINMGLYGIISTVTLQCEDSYAIKHTQTTMKASEFFKDKQSNQAWIDYFKSAPYIRFLWFAQKGVDNVQEWKGDRIVGEDLNNHPGLFSINPAPVKYDIATIEQMGLKIMYLLVPSTPPYNKCLSWFLRTVIGLAEPVSKPVTAVGWWNNDLSMDNDIQDDLFPVKFTELFIPLEQMNLTMEVLRDYFQGDNGDLARTGPLAFEFYCGVKCKYTMSMSNSDGIYKDESCFRVDIFYPGFSGGKPQVFYRQFWNLLHEKGINYRCHWGKYQVTRYQAPRFGTGLDEAAFNALSSDEKKQAYLQGLYPGFKDWCKQREEQDPKCTFLTEYWSIVLGIPGSPSSEQMKLSEVPKSNQVVPQSVAVPQAAQTTGEDDKFSMEVEN